MRTAAALLIFLFWFEPFSWASSESSTVHPPQDVNDAHSDHHKGEHHGHGSSKAIGEGKAITEVDEAHGFKLSPQAVQSLGLKTKSIRSRAFEVPRSALVLVNDRAGLYRLREGFYKFIPIDGWDVSAKTLNVQSKEFREGDEIVVRGVGLLRVSDVYSTDEAEYGHGH